jgi:hypothetical protein
MLGEIYELMNEKLKAIENYKILISLDPENDEAAQRLEQLQTE